MNNLEQAARQALKRLKTAQEDADAPGQCRDITEIQIAGDLWPETVALRAAIAQQAEPVHSLVSDREYLRLFEEARKGSDRASGVLRGIRAVIAAYEAATPKQAEPVAYQDTAKPTEIVVAADWENIDPAWHWMYRPLYAAPQKQAEPVVDKEQAKPVVEPVVEPDDASGNASY